MNKFSAIASLIAVSAFASPYAREPRRNTDPHSAAAKAARSANQK